MIYLLLGYLRKKHNRETYCSSKCKKYAHQEQKAIFANKYRRQYPKKECLGTSGLTERPPRTKPSTDFACFLEYTPTATVMQRNIIVNNIFINIVKEL